MNHKLYLKKDGKIQLVDFKDPQLNLGAVVAKILDEGIAQYFFCIADQSRPGQYRLHPVRQLNGTPTNILDQYYIYNPKENQYSTDIFKTTEANRQLKFDANQVLTNKEIAQITALLPIENKVRTSLKDHEQSASMVNSDFSLIQHRAYHQYALNLLQTCLISQDPEQIKQALADHWQNIKDNSLCYTTLSNDTRYTDLILLFCELAIALAKILPETSPIKLLMPTIETESQYPKNFPDLNHPAFSEAPEALLRIFQTHIIGMSGQCLTPINLLANPTNPYIDETTSKLEGGEYPNINIDDFTQGRLINPYFNQDKPTETGLLNADTIYRLKYFSPKTEALFQLKEEYDKRCHQDSATLYSQLLKLIAGLHTASSHQGAGRAEAMAEFGETIIGKFFDFYNALTQNKTLTQLAHEHKDSFSTGTAKDLDEIKQKLEALKIRDNKIIWCTGILAESLEERVKRNREVLQKIATEQTTIQKLIDQKRHSFERTQHDILSATSTSAYASKRDHSETTPSDQTFSHPIHAPHLNGKDHLGITKDSLELLQIHKHFHIKNMTELAQLLRMPPKEIKEICKMDKISQEIAYTLHEWNQNEPNLLGMKSKSLENLIILATTYNDEVLYTFFEANINILFVHSLGIFANVSELTQFLSAIRDSMKGRLLECFKEKLPSLINNLEHLAQLLNCEQLNEIHRTQILDCLEDKLHSLTSRIHNWNSLIRILKSEKLTNQHRTRIFNIARQNLSKVLTDISKSAELIKFEFLTEEQRNEIFLATLAQIHTLIGHDTKGISILGSIAFTDKQHTELLHSLKGKLSKNITPNFYNLMLLLNTDKFNEQHLIIILNDIKDKLNNLTLQNSSQLLQILDHKKLPQAYRNKIFDILINQLPANITKKEFIALFECEKLTDDQRTQILQILKDKDVLIKVIQPSLAGRSLELEHRLSNYKPLAFLNHPKITAAQRTLILNTLKDPQSHTLITNMNDLYEVLEYKNLSDENLTQILCLAKSAIQKLMIPGGVSVLLELLNCDKLTNTHRTQILTILLDEKKRNNNLFNNITYHNYNPDRLLTLLSSNQLEASHILLIFNIFEAYNYNYLEQLDTNLLLTLFKSDSLDDECLKKRIDKILHITDKCSPRCKINSIAKLLELLELENLTNKQRTQILGMFNFSLAEKIKTVDELFNLLNCGKLTNTDRTEILTTLTGSHYLNNSLIRNIFDKFPSNLQNLLESTKLEASHITLILSKLEANTIDGLEMTLDKLLLLFSYDKLTEQHRSQILNTLKSHIPALIDNVSSLKDLLSHDMLTEQHRTQILNILSHKTPELIDCHRLLHNLLSCDKLTDVHRTHVLENVKNKLSNMIQRAILAMSSNDSNLCTISDDLDWMQKIVTNEEVTKHHRTLILDAEKIAISNIIENTNTRHSLFSKLQSLSDSHRTRILEIITLKLYNLAEQNPDHLGELLIDNDNQILMECITSNVEKFKAIFLKKDSLKEFMKSLSEKNKYHTPQTGSKDELLNCLNHLITSYTVGILSGKTYESGPALFQNKSYSLESKLKAALEIRDKLNDPQQKESSELQKTKEQGRLGEVYRFTLKQKREDSHTTKQNDTELAKAHREKCKV